MATNYTVKKGDTLNQIAQQFGYGNYKQAGLTTKSGNPDLIRPGETFSINQAATSPARDTFVSNNASNPNVGDSAPTPTVDNTPSEDPYGAYRGYLKQYGESFQETPQIISAREKLYGLQNASDQTSLNARKAYQDAFTQNPGMLKSGVEQTAAGLNKDNSYILANLGVAESGAARTLNALTAGQESKQNYLKNQAELSKPFEAAGNYYDPTTGKLIPRAPEERTGIIGEYEYARSKGYTGSFNDYQNEDANRKRSVAAPAKQTAADRKEIRTSDVNAAANQLRQIVKARGFEGISLDDYNAMREYLSTEYGYEALLEFEDAIKAMGLTVDYNPENPGLDKPRK